MTDNGYLQFSRVQHYKDGKRVGIDLLVHHPPLAKVNSGELKVHEDPGLVISVKEFRDANGKKVGRSLGGGAYDWIQVVPDHRNGEREGTALKYMDVRGRRPSWDFS